MRTHITLWACLVAALLLAPAAPAQLRLQQAELQASPGALLQRYTRDSLVFERRRSQTTLTGSTHFLLQTHWGMANSRWQLGLGSACVPIGLL